MEEEIRTRIHGHLAPAPTHSRSLRVVEQGRIASAKMDAGTMATVGAASALLSFSAIMDLLGFARRIVDTILRDAVWLLLRCRESCDAS